MNKARVWTAHQSEVASVIWAWGAASDAGNLDAQLALMTDDVTFLTAGSAPMSRADFIAGFTRMTAFVRLLCHSDIQEVTITGDVSVIWNRLSIEITPLAGGATIRRTGDTLTVLRRGKDDMWRIWRDANMLTAAEPRATP